MAIQRDSIVVIKSTDFNDADKIVRVFGRSRGKFSLIAKGIKKIKSKNRGNLQTLSHSQIAYFPGKNLGILRDSKGLNNGWRKDSDIESISRVLRFIDKLLIEDQPEIEIFDKLVDVVKEGLSIENTNKFRIWSLNLLGFIPDKGACLVCSQGESLDYFDLENLAPVCSNCISEIKQTSRPIFLKTDLDYSSPQVSSYLDNYVERIIEQ